MIDNISRFNGERFTAGERLALVHGLVGVFLSINLLLIMIFFSKAAFYATIRYILFALTLLSDSFLLMMSDVLYMLAYFNYTMKISVCLFIYIFVSICMFVTPLALTAMTMERYVAICIPLRHAEICSSQRALRYLIMIHGVGSIPIIIIASMFFASAPDSMYGQYRVCSMDVFVYLEWQKYVKLAVYQCYFFVMAIIIVISYVKILKVAKAASQENRKATNKGLRTVALHAFQLSLCLIQLCCPFIETSLLMRRQIDLMVYHNFRYFNYILFTLTPRCLSPLIYGLRDEKLFLELKYKTCWCSPCLKSNAHVCVGT